MTVWIKNTRPWGRAVAADAVDLCTARDCDLEEVGDYIALGNPPRALTFIRGLGAQRRTILDNPRALPAREDLAPGLRVLPYGQYLIFARPVDTTVRIERLLHGARDVGTPFTSE